MYEFTQAHLNGSLIVMGLLCIAGGAYMYLKFRDEPFSFTPFCGALLVLCGVMTLVPGIFFDL